MASRSPRLLVLPRSGVLLVSGDLHGNGSDWRRLVHLFEDELSRNPATHWVLLGDVVHGPDEEARTRDPELYDYPDESWPIVEELMRLIEQVPGQVHYVLGNHDFSHAGGPHTRKFHTDEAVHLESLLSLADRGRLQTFFEGALLAVAAPCGALMTHGSPDDGLVSLEELDEIDLPPTREEHWQLLHAWLTSYGQPREVTERLLATARRSVPGLTLVVHGHDRDTNGYFTEGGNQLCPVLFGAPRRNKRYLRLDLSASYPDALAMSDGIEILRLHSQ